LRLLFDDVEHVLAEGARQLAPVDRTDALDQTGAQVLLDALQGGRRGGAQEGGFELRAVFAVLFPAARRLDVLARRDRRRVADQGDEILVTARLDPQNAVAGLGYIPDLCEILP
jgi:hypothetical protein